MLTVGSLFRSLSVNIAKKQHHVHFFDYCHCEASEITSPVKKAQNYRIVKDLFKLKQKFDVSSEALRREILAFARMLLGR